MKKLLLTLMLAVVSSSAIAEWVEIGETDKETTKAYASTFYADPDTIRITGNRVKMWSLVDYKITMEEIGVTSSKSQDEYDCKEKKQRVLFISFYSRHMGKGETVVIHNERGDWKPTSPGSANEAILKFACSFHPELSQTFPSDTLS